MNATSRKPKKLTDLKLESFGLCWQEEALSSLKKIY